MNYLQLRPYHHRQRARLHRKVHAELEYNVIKAIYDTLSRVHKDNLNISNDFQLLSFKTFNKRSCKFLVNAHSVLL